MTYQAIVCVQDDLLVVFIDRDDATAQVTYQYDDRDEQPTPFRTADMPMDDQAAAAMVNDWIQ